MSSNTMSRLTGLVITATLSMVVLTGCTLTGPTVVNSPASEEVSGSIVRVGGPAGAKSTPLTATAVVYSATSNQSSISGAPVMKVRTSVSMGGRFTLHLLPGKYLLVAESAAGTMISAPKRITLAANGATLSIALIVSVP